MGLQVINTSSHILCLFVMVNKKKKIMPKKSNAFIFLYSLRKLPHTHFFLIEVKNKNQSNAPSFLCKRNQNKLCAFRPQSKKTKKNIQKVNKRKQKTKKR